MKSKKKQSPNPRGIFVLWISILLVFAVSSCQKDEFFLDLAPEAEPQTLLKSTKIAEGKYEGNYDGGKWLISLPDLETWNEQDYRYMIFYAHGMVDPQLFEEVALPDDQIGGKSVEEIVTGMNMGYATTSYRDNGLIVLDAVEDIKKLVDVVNDFFEQNEGYETPDFIFLGGPSEGGMVTVKTIEKYPRLFDGAISICGPVGDFYQQLQYNGDFHVLFNYFFGQELAALSIDLGNPKAGVDEAIMWAWKEGIDGDLQQAIVGIMQKYPDRVPQLLKCAKVTVDMTDPDAMGTAVLELLRFNIMLTNDIKERMEGVPYDNTRKWYRGSKNDRLLNRSVQRISGESEAIDNVKKYETSGEIEVPLVTIRTTGDHITPFWHYPKYQLKIFRNRNHLLHTGIPVVNYGHCTIEESHVMAALAIVISNARLINY